MIKFLLKVQEQNEDRNWKSDSLRQFPVNLIIYQLRNQLT